MTVYNAIDSNKRKTFFIMILFIMFFVTVAYIFGQAAGGGYGLSYAGIFLIISGLMSFFSYYYSDKIVLAMSGAKKADPHRDSEVIHIVEQLCIASGLPKPAVYIVNDQAPNAFATGRDPKHAAVAVTTGLLSILKRSELEGVIAHELSHVKNYDTRVMGVVSILVGAIAILSDVFMRSLWFGGLGGDRDDDNKGNQIFMILAIIASILAPIAASLIQLAISRRREFLADASGALLTRYPEGLANALEKIAGDRHVLKSASNATAHFYIENPFKADAHKSRSWIINLFSTHPPVEERVKILRSM